MAARLRPRHQDGVEQGKRLVRLDSAKGASLAEWLSRRLARIAWQTPLHRLRLRGRFPLKLLAVPPDPLTGEVSAGEALLAGEFLFCGEVAEAEGIDFAALTGSPGLIDYLQSFAWLRDLDAAASRARAAPIAEYLARRWLAAHAEKIDDAGWRPDLWGRRMFHWAAHAPMLLASSDQVYRTSLLNTFARGARHLQRSANRVSPGLPRIAAWSGVIAAALVVQGGPARLKSGEAGLTRAFGLSLHDDGGLVSRSPTEQIAMVEILGQLRAVYTAARREVPEWLTESLTSGVGAMLSVTLGDGSSPDCGP